MTDVLSRHNDAAEPTERHSLSRRQLIKAGAWAAPVIVLATAAPAAAASIDQGDAVVNMWTFSQHEFERTASNALDFMVGSLQFTPNWDVNQSITSATITLVVPVGGLDPSRTASVREGDGWVFAGQVFQSESAIFTFTWAGSVAASVSSSQLYYKLPVQSAVISAHLPKTVTGTLSGPQFTSLMKSVQFA